MSASTVEPHPLDAALTGMIPGADVASLEFLQMARFAVRAVVGALSALGRPVDNAAVIEHLECPDRLGVDYLLHRFKALGWTDWDVGVAAIARTLRRDKANNALAMHPPELIAVFEFARQRGMDDSTVAALWLFMRHNEAWRRRAVATVQRVCDAMTVATGT